MSQWDIQSAVESLRTEMHEGFNSIREDQSDLRERVTKIENTQTVVGRGMWGLIMAFISAAIGWAFSK